MEYKIWGQRKVKPEGYRIWNGITFFLFDISEVSRMILSISEEQLIKLNSFETVTTEGLQLYVP